MVIASIVLPVMSLLQGSLLFKPNKSPVCPLEPSHSYGLPLHESFITTSDQVRLSLWHVQPQKAGAPTVVCFHGNTGNWGDVGGDETDKPNTRRYRVQLLKALLEHGFGVVAVSMRGYGRSDKVTPSEAGFLRDVRAINHWLLYEKKLIPEKLIYLGESLGSAVALLAAESLYRVENKKAAMVTCLAAFSSIPQKTSELYAFLPLAEARKRMYSRFEADRTVASLSLETYLLLLAPENDMTTPKSHSYRLKAVADEQGIPNTLLELKNAGHISWNATEVALLVKSFYSALGSSA